MSAGVRVPGEWEGAPDEGAFTDMVKRLNGQPHFGGEGISEKVRCGLYAGLSGRDGSHLYGDEAPVLSFEWRRRSAQSFALEAHGHLYADEAARAVVSFFMRTRRPLTHRSCGAGANVVAGADDAEPGGFLQCAVRDGGPCEAITYEAAVAILQRLLCRRSAVCDSNVDV